MVRSDATSNFADVTSQFNDSISKLAEQKIAIEDHDSEIQSLTTKYANVSLQAINATRAKIRFAPSG